MGLRCLRGVPLREPQPSLDKGGLGALRRSDLLTTLPTVALPETERMGWEPTSSSAPESDCERDGDAGVRLRTGSEPEVEQWTPSSASRFLKSLVASSCKRGDLWLGARAWCWNCAWPGCRV